MTAGRRIRLVLVVALVALAAATARTGERRDAPGPVDLLRSQATLSSSPSGLPDAASLAPRADDARSPAGVDRAASSRLLVAALLGLGLLVAGDRGGWRTSWRRPGPAPTLIRRHAIALRAPPLLLLTAR